MHKVDLCEYFLEEPNRANPNDKALVVNNFCVADDEKQHYEALFRKVLSETDATFHFLQLYSQEL